MYELTLPRMETINSTAKLFNLPKYFVRQLVLQNKIKFVKAGKKYFVNVNSLIMYLNHGEESVEKDVKCKKII